MIVLSGLLVLFFDWLTGLNGRGLKDKIKFLVHADSIGLERDSPLREKLHS